MQRNVTRLVVAIAFLAACVALGFIGFVLLIGDSSGARVEAQIGETRFVYKRVYARDPATAVGGRADRLAFAAAFPDFAPLARAKAAMSSRDIAERNRKTVFLTVSAAEGMEPSDRPAQLYSRFLEADAASGPGGLIVRQFESSSPYQGERLLVAPPDGRLFFARCPMEGPSSSATIESCLFVFRMKSLDVELRFAPSLLEHWETLIDGPRRFLSSIQLVQRGK